MTETQQPFEKAGLLEALSASRRQVAEFFESLPDEKFIARPVDKWSPLDHWRHLVKSVRPLARALRLPRFVLRLMFGRSKRPSRSYSEIRQTYRAALAAGGKAGRFAPLLEDVSLDKAEACRRSVSADWETAASDLTAALSAWREADLDRLRLPHPLLGKLTVREMLLFTLYHNLHHMENVRNRLELKEIHGKNAGT